MAVMFIVFFISFLFLQRSDQMQENINLLFENKIGCVAKLFGFNGGQQEILKTSAWISLNDMMISQPKDYTEDQIHIAQWILVIQIAKNVQQMLNMNNAYSSNNIWQETEIVTNGRQDGYPTMHLIDYMVERCR